MTGNEKKPEHGSQHAPTPADILKAFRGGIEPVRPSIVYQGALFAVAVAMVLLPLFYVALIVGTAWGLWYHGTEHITVFDTASHWRWAALQYITPLVVGSVLIVVMLKPLFARRAKMGELIVVTEQEEPELHAFVERIADAVNAPTPSEIVLHWEPNASAGFRQGWWSMLEGDLRLMIGMPLVAHMNTRELGGVIAHELGHFSQGAGMRFTYIIRTINGWFARLVYQRDRVDEHLAKASQAYTGHIAINLMILLAMFVVWFVREILRLLMYVGHLLSCFAMRQMEFDADRYETRLSGSKTFPKTTAKMMRLGLAFQQATQQLGTARSEGKLPDDLASLVAFNAASLPEEVEAYVDHNLKHARTGFFDSHPCDADRITRALNEDAPGVFALEESSTRLFRNYKARTRHVSLRAYQENMDDGIRDGELVPVKQIIQRAKIADIGAKAARRFLLLDLHAAVPIRLDLDTAERPVAQDTLLNDILGSRNAMANAASVATLLLASVRGAQDQLLVSSRAAGLLAAGLTILPSEFGLQRGHHAEAIAHRDAAHAMLKEATSSFEELISQARRRFNACVRMLQTNASLDGIPDCAKVRRRAIRLSQVLSLLSDLRPLEVEAQLLAVQLHEVFGAVGNDDHLLETAKPWLVDAKNALHGQLQRIAARVSDVSYPLEHNRGRLTIAEFAFGDPSISDDLGAMMGHAFDGIERLIDLRFQIIGRIGMVVEKVERAMGLEALAMPEPAHASNAG